MVYVYDPFDHQRSIRCERCVHMSLCDTCDIAFNVSNGAFLCASYGTYRINGVIDDFIAIFLLLGRCGDFNVLFGIFVRHYRRDASGL